MNIAEAATAFGDMQVCIPESEERISAIGKDGPNWSSLMAAGDVEAMLACYPAQVCLALLHLKAAPAATLLVYRSPLNHCCCSLETGESLDTLCGLCGAAKRSNSHSGQSIPEAGALHLSQHECMCVVVFSALQAALMARLWCCCVQRGLLGRHRL